MRMIEFQKKLDLSGMKYVPIILCAFVFGCNSPTKTPVQENATTSTPNNTWRNPQLTAVLNAQDHRDSKTLLEFLNDTSAAVRNAAAIAFASVQDSTARAGLLSALKDPNASVRSAAAWSLGFVPDSAVTNALVIAAGTESDSAAATVLRAAAFRAWAKTTPKLDANALLERLRNSSGYQRACVAEVLRRLPKEQLLLVERDYVELLRNEERLGVKLLLLSGMRSFSDTLARNTVNELLRDPDPAIRVNALRSFVAMDKANAAPALYHALRDTIAAVRQTAVEFLQGMKTVNGDSCWIAGQTSPDVMVKIPLYGLAMRYGTEGTPNVAAALLTSLWGMDTDPYVRAALITARASATPMDSLIAWMEKPWPAAARQAAFASAVAQTRKTMERARYASRKARYAQLAQVLKAAFATGDAGLIAAAADDLLKEDAEVIAMVLDTATEQQVQRRFASHPRPGGTTNAGPSDRQTRWTSGSAPSRSGLRSSHRSYATCNVEGRQAISHHHHARRHRYRHRTGCGAGHLRGLRFTRYSRLTTTANTSIVWCRISWPKAAARAAMAMARWTGRCARRSVTMASFTGAVGVASAGRDTENCQFFIMLADAPHLDGRYTRFAHVVSGLENAQRLVVGDRMVRVARME
jgi:predicted transcriptional regulator